MRWQEAPRVDLAWLCERANVAPSPGLMAIEALDRNGQIAGMVGYDGWTEGSCCMHIALASPAALRTLIRPAFGIPFVELGRRVTLAMVLATNARSLALCHHVGFRDLCRIRDAWKPGVDMVLLEMRREWCRYIPEEVRRAA